VPNILVYSVEETQGLVGLSLVRLMGEDSYDVLLDLLYHHN
jgi:hypothetical protein